MISYTKIGKIPANESPFHNNSAFVSYLLCLKSSDPCRRFPIKIHEGVLKKQVFMCVTVVVRQSPSVRG